MKQDYPYISKEALCRLFGKTRHAYYDHGWRHQDQSLKDDIILQLVHQIRNSSLPRLGTRKLLVYSSLIWTPIKSRLGGTICLIYSMSTNS